MKAIDVIRIGLSRRRAAAIAAASSVDAGGFLAITNLDADLEAPLRTVTGGWSLRFPVEQATSPEMTLARGAALSANFPPVFSNMPVSSADGRRLWVTDGGVVENRGAISALLALSDALKKLPQEPAGSLPDLPPVRLVIAEASATSIRYSSDRGVGAKFGASAQIANGLMNSLLGKVNAQHERVSGKANCVKFVYLPLSDALRESGTFGTHWMMPDSIPLGGALQAKLKGTLSLDAARVVELMDLMFSEDLDKDFISSNWSETPDRADEIVKRLNTSVWGALQAGLATDPESCKAPANEQNVR